ncbi:biopolymer transporter ExbD, partial [Campylobacter jejuni]
MNLQILFIYFFIGVILMIRTEMTHKEEELSEINITPFIDIMLV